MLVNRNEIVCDECGARIESFPKPRGWHNPLTAEAHVCSECWDEERKRAWAAQSDWTRALQGCKYPLRTSIGRVVKDDIVGKVMEKYGVSQT